MTRFSRIVQLKVHDLPLMKSQSTPMIFRFPSRPAEEDPIVITGIGMAASVGSSRESVWKAVQSGRSGIRLTTASDNVGPLELPCGMVDWLPDHHQSLKSVQISERIAAEALDDAEIQWPSVDRERFACSVSAQFGDIGYLFPERAISDAATGRQWWREFLPCSASQIVAKRFDLRGPRLCHATACASGLISTIVAARMLQMDQADYALCGAADAVTDLCFAAFHRMGVLARGPEPATACRPFDVTREGFVMGEGGAMLVLERRSHAVERGAKIYAELAASQTLCQAHHVTGLDGEAETLTRLIQDLVRKAGWDYRGPQYINAHGTGTEQNDISELKAIRAALQSQADDLVVSSNKAILGHTINAAGSLELALTAMSLRDGFAPPTMHLTQPESVGNIDCLPEYGEQRELDRALKLSLAFGGHLVGVAIRRCPLDDFQRPAEPLAPSARIREPAAARLVRKAA
ncbi:MAG: beta-ketoacyl-[acyl-carrier-protein] synthase family protein [Pirellulaceae bacterium]